MRQALLFILLNLCFYPFLGQAAQATEPLLKCKTSGDSFTAILELASEDKGNLKIKDPPPFDRVTNCKLSKAWSSGDDKKAIEFKRGICSPERAFEKTELFNTVLVWLEKRQGKIVEAKVQYRLKGGIETCLF